MILRVAWLQTLGIIKWDFENFSMSFSFYDRNITLIGLNNPNFINEGGFPNYNSLKRRELLLQLLQEPSSKEHCQAPEEIKMLLKNYHDFLLNLKASHPTKTKIILSFYNQEPNQFQ